MSVVVRRMIIGCENIILVRIMARRLLVPFAAILAVFAFGLLIATPRMAAAAKVSGLYKTEVKVASQGDRERKEAMGKALGQVLINVTGETRSLANSKLKEAMQQPDRYVKGFSYRRDTASNQQQQYLQVSFVEESVKRLLREAGLAIWGENRPTTLTWLAIDDGHARTIQRGIASDPLVQSLESRFVGRALPLIFPLMDFEDAQVLTPVDVWGLFTAKLEDASRRYGAESILAGRLSVNDGVYNGRLSLIFRGQRQDAEVSGLSYEQLALVGSRSCG